MSGWFVVMHTYSLYPPFRCYCHSLMKASSASWRAGLKTERGAKGHGVTVVGRNVVHGVFAAVGIVVASQKAVNLRVNEKVVRQRANLQI